MGRKFHPIFKRTYANVTIKAEWIVEKLRGFFRMPAFEVLGNRSADLQAELSVALPQPIIKSFALSADMGKPQSGEICNQCAGNTAGRKFRQR